MGFSMSVAGSLLYRADLSSTVRFSQFPIPFSAKSGLERFFVHLFLSPLLKPCTSVHSIFSASLPAMCKPSLLLIGNGRQARLGLSS